MFEQEYFALTEAAGLCDLSDRGRLEATGDDCRSFLHKLTTNDVNALPQDGGCEAFFLDARGHVLGHAFLISAGQAIVMETATGQNLTLLKHLDRYLIREKVELHDRTNQWAELILAGAQSQEVLGRLANHRPPSATLASAELELAGTAALVARVEMTRPGGYLLFLRDRDRRQAVIDALCAQGAVRCGNEAFTAARLEAGFPLYGQDLSDKNLPQEVARDDLAISFNKGCYLGQETVARIDALGHVNKTLVRLRFEGGELPPPGTELLAGQVDVGQVTSAAFSPREKACIALGYVRRGSNEPGVKLASAFGPATVEQARR